MKHILLSAALAGLTVFAPAVSPAQTNSTVSLDKHTLDKRINPVLAALKLEDQAKESLVYNILAVQLEALHIWHAANDAQIKSLWSDFDNARKPPMNPTNASAALAKIGDVYATFKPQHDQFLAGLSTVLSPDQVETVKDVLTINKVKVTYDVYLQIFPTLTEAQKAVVLQHLKQAREEAIDCEAMTEKSAFFKKYKLVIEDDYLTAQGYNPKQARQEFAARQKAGAAEKKAAAK